MKLYAISDLHLNYRVNLQAVEALPPHADDWLILAGDIADTEVHLQYALSLLTAKFRQVIWVPGNHDLWTLPIDRSGLRGVAKYDRLVSICRDYGVLTPEDPYVYWPGSGGKHLLVPLFLLYDYTFRPDDIPVESALDWAIESGVICTDEDLLHSAPFISRADWCAERCRLTQERLNRISPQASLILINHFPLRQDLVNLMRYPRFSIWCGTRKTEDWHTRYPVARVVYGHLHIRGTAYRDGVCFEEVSLGYPRNWTQARGLEYYLREILPGK